MNPNSQTDSKPWWHYGHMWLVVGGPLVVVVAAFVTFYLAFSTPNEIVSDQEIVVRPKDPNAKLMDSGMAPAMQARNHAQTGQIPAPKNSVAD